MADSDQESDELALRAPIINTSPGREYADEKRMFQGIPGIERASNGRLWAVWYGGGTGETGENYIMLATSEDDGETWSDLKAVIDPPFPVRAFDPCLWIDPEYDLHLFWAQSYNHFDGRAGVWHVTAEDPGEEDTAWSEPTRISNGVMMNKPTVLSDGTWLLPTAVWGRSERDDVPAEEKRPNVFASPDRGGSWSLRGGPEMPGEKFSEHMIVEKLDQTLWMLIRVEGGIAQSFSRDRGTTWSNAELWRIRHPTARFYIRRLLSGNLILVKHGPLDELTGRSHLTAYISEDDGDTWLGGLVIDEREGVSYPDAVQSPEGTIYVIYDFERRGAKRILLATFTEEDDVKSGQWTSDRSRRRILVNQATGAAP